MDEWFRLVGPNRALEVFGVKLVGVTAENGSKLVFTIIFFLVLSATAAIAHRVAHHWLQARKDLEFWSRQIIRVATTVP